jgi:hypothetical protein
LRRQQAEGALLQKRVLEKEKEKEKEEDKMGSELDSFVKIPTIKFTKLFINGDFVDSISGFLFSTSLSALFTSHMNVRLDFSDNNNFTPMIPHVFRHVVYIKVLQEATEFIRKKNKIIKRE